MRLIAATSKRKGRTDATAEASAGSAASLRRGFLIHGERVVLAAPDTDALERLVALLPPGLPTCEPLDIDPRFALVRERGGSWRYLWPSGLGPLCTDLDLVTGMLDSELRRWVADHASERAFVHAGVVAYRGRAIVIPGSSFSGKTSLVAELVRAGAEYYSDEYAVIDEHGLVHPYARPLSIRRPGAEMEARPAAQDLGGTTGTEPVPVGMIVTSTYRPGATFEPERRSAGHGMLALLGHSSLASKLPRRAMAIMQQAAAEALVLEGERGEATDAARAILDLAERTTSEPPAAPVRRRRHEAVGPHDVGMEIYGARARVEVPSADLVDRVLDQLPPHARQCEPRTGDATISLAPAPDGGYAILENGNLRLPSLRLELALSGLRRELFYFAIHHARDHLVISAAVVAHEGRAIVLPGVPKCGKTILMAALLRRGAVYYADDWGLFDPEGAVLPYPTKFKLDGKRISAASLGATTGEEPIRVGLIARVTYEANGRWRVQQRPSEEAAAWTAWHSYGRDDSVGAMEIARRAVVGARYFDGVRGDADAAADAVLELAGQRSVERSA